MWHGGEWGTVCSVQGEIRNKRLLSTYRMAI